MAAKPQRLILRAYQVGFGDCFLLSFRYRPSGDDGDRHVLIDFGSTGKPATAGDKLLLRVAQDIRKACGGKLHAVVATHRHKDHISGFATNREGTASGDIIASLEPDVIIQPWTEDPDARPDARHATMRFTQDDKALTAALMSMHAFSQTTLDEVARRGQTFGVMARSQLDFLGEDNLENKSAIENLMHMGKKGKAVYVNFGSDPQLGNVLPGVKTTVLGPPTLDQSADIRKQRAKDTSEFWHLQAAAGERFTARGVPPFDKQYRAADQPAYTNWFIPRMDALRGGPAAGDRAVAGQTDEQHQRDPPVRSGRQEVALPGGRADRELVLRS